MSAISAIRQALRDQDFDRLFVEALGWDRTPKSPITLSVDGTQHDLRPVAQKRGAVVCVLDELPDRAGRARIERALAKIHFEHVVAYVDRVSGDQVWQWAKRDPGRPVALREHWLRKGQSGESLAERLAGLTVALDEEEDLTLPDVTARMRRTFDADRVTRAFYDRFQDEHAAFLGFISGIITDGDREWYASLMLNRLMFTYFVQKKGFLDGNLDYLRDRLNVTQMRRGRGKFLTFYRHFLRRLFHEGFAQQRSVVDQELDELIGRVPYLNGGLFEVHQLERLFPEIEIPDEAFTRLFDFFDGYTWHLDERPLRNDREINPDVLGYIFEKYINQKQMGAYYTREDITEYISKNTLVPFLLEAARSECKVAFENPNGPTVWDLLKTDPDRYIYPAVRHATDESLPAEIALGVFPPTYHKMVSDRPVQTLELRNGWNKSAPSKYALHTESWREVVARRTRYEEIRGKLVHGEVSDIDELITLNLDIRQFAQDIIDSSEGPELLRAFWNAIEKVTILDPTCGSGAFLFAALNILESLYDACLNRMEAFVEDLDRSEATHHSEKFADFRVVLERVAAHPNRRYFILKSIILNNLYGVDIMEEAVEICKLRLFLKLAAQVEPDTRQKNYGVEPLPDIDFNIKTGNTLVGFATYEDAKRAVTSKLDFDNTMEKIAVRAAALEHAFDAFRERQVMGDGSVPTEQKLDLRGRLAELQDELNRYLAGEYGVDASDKDAYDRWRASHQPFHWFVEYHGPVSGGGFDVIIGNPPYVERRVIDPKYRLLAYETGATNNLFAYCAERAFTLLGDTGRFGFIVPLSSMATDKFEPLQRLVLSRGRAWLSNFDDRPSRLFDGLEHIQLTIILLAKGTTEPVLPSTTGCRKWSAGERAHLFATMHYSQLHRAYMTGSVAKAGGDIEVAILDKLWRKTSRLANSVREAARYKIFYTRKVHAYVNILDFVPRIQDGGGKVRQPSEQKTLDFLSEELRDAALCALNTTLFRWYLATFSDCRNLNRRDVLSFPIDLSEAVTAEGAVLGKLARRLSKNLQETSEMRKMRFKDDVLNVQCIIPRFSKAILDEIDYVLSRHYGLSEEELDFIINYDIKYRMGGSNEDDD